jgi:hypothetical protein
VSEQAGVIHTLVVHGDDPVDVVFSIAGSIIYFDEADQVDRIEDWISVLDDYRLGCANQRSPMSVIGVPQGSA